MVEKIQIYELESRITDHVESLTAEDMAELAEYLFGNKRVTWKEETAEFIFVDRSTCWKCDRQVDHDKCEVE